jgi:hypothetical protein
MGRFHKVITWPEKRSLILGHSVISIILGCGRIAIGRDDMAILKLQAPVSGLRGKYGGMIFSANKSGPYIRQWVKPVAKRTVAQVSKRARMAMISHAWSVLDQGQIDAWDALALAPPEDDYNSLNVLILLSGAAWHMRVNLRRLEAGQAYEADCPANVVVDPATSFSMTVHTFDNVVDDDTFDYTDGDFDAGYAVLQVSLAPAGFRQVMTTGFMSVWCGAVEQDTWTRINEELATAFGWLVEPQKLFGRLYHQSETGIRSVALETSCVVEA